ncbi:SARP family transcriptional regulator, partial [Streptomyces sp. AcH 505]|uniref:AAA family ATPase n=1 Tax=Streptomyces sp. AcH 505 TaxID=352211 RepID=UPI000591C656
RAAVAYLATVAARAPVLLVFDDLHWADEETLALLTALATDPDTGPVLIVGTYRTTETSAALTDALGRTARAEPARIYLGGLPEPRVRELVRALTDGARSDGTHADRAMTPDAARLIHERSAGNPFFVRELTRLWESEGEAGLHTVPPGVRETIRHRLAALTGTARTQLRQAAVIGPEIDLDLLIPLAGDEQLVLDTVESALLAGFLVERDADRLRFTHALVHETLYDDIALARRARWHASVAGIIEEVRPDDVMAIAHHLLRAGSRAPGARTAHYTRAAAERAERRSAPHEAARLWRETVAA